MKVIGKKMRQVVWELIEQTDFALSAGYGRMKLDLLPNGLTLYRSHIEITDPVELVLHGDTGKQFIGTQYFQMGHGEMELANGTLQSCTPDHAILLRADTSPTKIRFRKPQVLRHIGVAKHLTNYQQEFGGLKCGLPQPFTDAGRPVTEILRAPVTKTLRTIAANLSRLKSETALEKLALHAQSLLFFSTVLHAFQSAAPLAADGFLQWELDAVHRLQAKLDDAPLQPANICSLAAEARMAPTRFEQAFRGITGHTVPEYTQILKLNAAQKLLLSSDTMIKQIAFDLGYDHVGNFSRAYQKFFGESPRRTRQRNSV